MKHEHEGGFLLTKIHHLAGRILSKKLRDYQLDEINPAQGRILFVLWREDGISIQELAKKTGLGKSTLTSMLDRLEHSGYLTRTLSTEDRRKILLHLTAKNKPLQAIYTQVSTEMNELFYQGFTTVEIEMFELYLRHILTNLTDYEQQLPTT